MNIFNKDKSVNQTGDAFENIVQSCLKYRSFDIINFNDLTRAYKNSFIYNKTIHIPYCERFVLKNVPYKTVSGRNGKTEFFLHCENSEDNPEFGNNFDYDNPLEFRIECKWQQITGSTEEKLSFAKDNVEFSISDNYMLVYGGEGFSSGMINFIKKEFERIRNKYNKKVYVLNFYEFLTWTNKYL